MAPPHLISVSPDTSILGVNVSFPIRFLPDPILDGVDFLRAPPHGRLEEATELVSASWINGSRAYILDADPGTYFVVAVSFRSETSDGPVSKQLVLLTAAMGQQTQTTIGPDRVGFAGSLQIRYWWSDRITTRTRIEDKLQRRMLGLLQPRMNEEVARSRQRFWEKTLNNSIYTPAKSSSISNEAVDREKFLDDARVDFGSSVWAEVIRSLE